MSNLLLAAALDEKATVGVERFTSSDYRTGRVHHMVLFRFRPGVDADSVSEVEARFRDLANTPRDGHPYILGIHSGRQLSTEGSAHGFELGFVVEFASLGDCNFYVGDPIVTEPGFFDETHDAFKHFVGPFLADGPDGVLVFDLQDERMLP